ncbi:MAG: FAD binding domain-containing protein [Methyloligellaceae bacterium]
MRYEAPSSIADVISCLSQNQNAYVLAGGTDLLVQLRAGIKKPDLIVDIKHLSETRSIDFQNDELIVGAAVAGAEFNEHQQAKTLCPGVAEAFDLIGSTQVQGRATLAGNLCNSSPAADSVPAMIAAGAIARIVGPNGERELAVEKVNTGPGKNCLSPGEFIVSFRFPKRPENSGDAYLRLIPRTEMDIAVVGVGINLTLDSADAKNVKCIAARVSLGAVAPTALLVEAAADALIGTSLDEKALAALASAASAACKPIDDKRGTIVYRTKIAGVLARRVALIARDRALGLDSGVNHV